MTYKNQETKPGALKLDIFSRENLLPSAFLRELHPEYYSDSSDSCSYELGSDEFGYLLETITNRNKTHEFEIFCKKLCERVICPNLRAATGPEGGGDSKADTETFAVAEEIMDCMYVGEPAAGSERWGFAFSAMKRWTDKVRSDVAGLVGTGRNYDRFICVTSRYARAKDRARVEDELAQKYGVPVEIHDRSWIIEEVVEKNRIDLAFNYLNAGRMNPNVRMGPNDYSRSQQLEDIEKSFDNPLAYKGMESQMVVESLLAAKLSRALERSRSDTDGRFERAKRIAGRYGTHRQQLEVQYEAIQTVFWWWNDFESLNTSYDQFEQMLRPDEHLKNLEFLLTLTLHLGNCVIHGHLTPEETRLEERSERLRNRLETIAQDQERPNSALEATTQLLQLKLTIASALGDVNQLIVSGIWSEFTDVLNRAKSLAEYDAEGLVRMIGVAGEIAAGHDASYNKLVEDAAAFVSNRTSEIEGARILVNRSKQLDFSQQFEMIRLLGKATRQLAKKESSAELIEALNLLALAYHSAGLRWAARATCLAVASLIQAQLEETGELNSIIVPVVEVWAWVSLELRHLPDLLCAMDLLAILWESLPLTIDSRKRLEKSYLQIDRGLGSYFLNSSDQEIKELMGLPDVLYRIPLHGSRMALLYLLGYEEKLLEEESISDAEWKEYADKSFSAWADTPAYDDFRSPMICNSREEQTFGTSIVGLKINVQASGSITSILIAECVLGTIEVFFATVPDLKIFPHVETFDIEVLESDTIEDPVFRLDEEEMRGVLEWPENKNPSQLDFQSTAGQSLVRVVGSILVATCHGFELQSKLQSLFKDELVGDRVTVLVGTSNSYKRFLSRPLSRLSDYTCPNDAVYTLRGRPNRPDRKHDNEPATTNTVLNDHRNLGVRSVINTHLWDSARWTGMFFFDFDPQAPPIIALTFQNREAARKIFDQWHQRFGSEDSDEFIYIGIIKDISSEHPFHYKVMVTAKPLNESNKGFSNLTFYPARLLEMTPSTSKNLDRFLCNYRRVGAYLLTAAIYEKGKVEPMFELAILKHHLTIKRIGDIEPNDMEAMVLAQTPSSD